MRTKWPLRLTVAILLALAAIAPSLAFTVSWFCDGRLCGVSLCCCDQPDARLADPNCAPNTKAPSREASVCAANCSCTPVLSSAVEHPSALTPVAEIPNPAICLLPETLSISPSPNIVRFTAVRLPDYRGPPASLPAFTSSGLRAPPAS